MAVQAKVHVHARISPGRIVHVVLGHGPSEGECRPGIVVREQDPSNRILRVHVLSDPDRDGALAQLNGVHSVSADAQGRPGSWHWPTECPAT